MRFEATRERALRALGLLLKPIAAFCLKHGIGIREATECLKFAFIASAQKTLEESTQETNLSRISLMTGIHRLETGRILKEGIKAPEHSLRNILSHWQYDKRFCSTTGEAKTLDYEGKQSQFASLVKAVSKDLNHYTVLLELERVGAISKAAGKVTLLKKSYLPQGDLQRGFEILSRDSALLHNAVQENILENFSPKHLHLCTQYDNIAASRLSEMRTWLLNEGSAFHTKVREYLSRFDRDLHPEIDPHEPRASMSFVTFNYSKDEKK